MKLVIILWKLEIIWIFERIGFDTSCLIRKNLIEKYPIGQSFERIGRPNKL